MKIFSTHFGPHDHNTYDGHLHRQVERYTREKHALSFKLNEYFDDIMKNKSSIIAFSMTVGGRRKLKNKSIILRQFEKWDPKHLWDYKMIDNLYYIDHHQSHAAYTFLSSGFKESDILAIDGRGWRYNCIFINRHGIITDLSDKMGLGQPWDKISLFLGFKGMSASKLMGLAAYGKFSSQAYTAIDYYVNCIRIDSRYHTSNKIPIKCANIFKKCNREDIAYTLQQYTLETIHDSICDLKTSDNICLAGGVAYNGYVNHDLTKIYKKVFVPPAPGDEGQSLGIYMHADKTINNNIHIPSVYSGEQYEYIGSKKLDVTYIAQQLAAGKIIGWFQGRSESGHRALGNRSILADPRNPNIKDIINNTIKMREDFRPFAPAVLEDYYMDYFDTNQPSPYMSRIVPVKSNLIPGVTHVDKTARIQTVNKKQNEKFYNLINEFYKITGIPMLLNTSFNCQEPIVETPDDAIKTFKKTALDIVVINDWIEEK